MQDSNKAPITNPLTRKALMQDFNQEPKNSGTHKVLMQDSNKAPTQEPTNSQGTNAGLQQGTNQERKK